MSIETTASRGLALAFVFAVGCGGSSNSMGVGGGTPAGGTLGAGGEGGGGSGPSFVQYESPGLATQGETYSNNGRLTSVTYHSFVQNTGTSGAADVTVSYQGNCGLADPNCCGGCPAGSTCNSGSCSEIADSGT